VLGLLSKKPAASWQDRYGDVTPRVHTEPVNGQTGLVVRQGDRPAVVVGLAVADDRVAVIDLVVNPEKFAEFA
jgi:hypothetical protein